MNVRKVGYKGRCQRLLGTHLWRVCLLLEEEVDWVSGSECGWVCESHTVMTDGYNSAAMTGV